VSAGQSVYDNETRNASQQDVDDAVAALNLAINKLHPYFLCDEVRDVPASANGRYDTESFAEVLDALINAALVNQSDLAAVEAAIQYCIRRHPTQM